MARPKRDNNLAARLLVDAALLGDATACAKHKTTLRTLQRYRAALKDDPELSRLYAELSAEVTSRSWAQELDDTLASGIRKMRELIEATKTPDSLEVVSEAVQGLAKIAITKEVLRADSDAERDSGHPHPDGEGEAPPRYAN